MKIIRIFLLFIIFFIPVAGIITTPSDLVLKGENRNITAFPEFGKNLFFLNLQKFLTDRLLYKIKFEEEFFPIFHDYFSFFKFDKNEISIEGRDGWLFFLDGLAANAYKQHCFSLDETIYRKSLLSNKIPFLKELSSFSQAKFYIVIGPDKHGVYPEYMDQHYGNPGQYRLFSKFKNVFENNDLTVIDPHDVLVEAKQQFIGKSLYFTDDTHWNLAGSKVAFDYLMKFILDDYQPIEYEFSFIKHKNGDLVRNIKQPNNDFLDDLNVTRANLPIVQVYDFYSNELISNSILNFKGPDFGTMVINSQSKDKRTILLLSDSFGYALKSYLSDYFYKVIHISGYCKKAASLKEIIEKAQPDIILYVNVERNVTL